MFDQILGRFARPFRRPAPFRDVSQQVYGAVMAQSRQPAFYLDYGIPDTVMGRFDLLCLHLFLISNRLTRETDPAARGLGQEVFDRFSEDVDRALREMGIGDTTVPKRKKRLIHGFYGQIEDFGAALDLGDAATLARNADQRFSGTEGSVRSGRLARYMLACRDALLGRSFADLAAARCDWPDPRAVH